MTITVNLLASVSNDANPHATIATGTITPTANARVVVYVYGGYDGGTFYLDPGLTTAITGWTTAPVRTSRAPDLAVGFNPVFNVFEGVMGPTPGGGTMTLEWDTVGTDGAYGCMQVVELVGSVATPTHKQAMAAARCEVDGNTSSETHTTNSLGSAATTGNTCLVSFGCGHDGIRASATPSGWTAVGTPQTANYSQIGVWSKTDFTGTSVTNTDLGLLVDHSGSALQEFEEVGGGGPPATMFLGPTQSTTRLL